MFPLGLGYVCSNLVRVCLFFFFTLNFQYIDPTVFFLIKLSIYWTFLVWCRKGLLASKKQITPTLELSCNTRRIKSTIGLGDQSWVLTMLSTETKDLKRWRWWCWQIVFLGPYLWDKSLVIFLYFVYKMFLSTRFFAKKIVFPWPVKDASFFLLIKYFSYFHSVQIVCSFGVMMWSGFICQRIMWCMQLCCSQIFQ